MKPNSEDTLRSLLEQDYPILEQYSHEVEQTHLPVERVEEILVKVKDLSLNFIHRVLDLISSNNDPVQLGCLESSLNHLQYAMEESKKASACRRTLLKRILYHSQMAMLSFWGWWHLLLPDALTGASKG